MDGIYKATTKRALLDLDPDYKEGHFCEAKRRYLAEESGQGQAQRHVVEVVVRELNLALAKKENEALQIQEKVQSCQRDLHLLRFGVTSNFYKNITNSDARSASANNSLSSVLKGQNAHHPAVLELLKFTAAGPKTRGVRNKRSPEGSSEESDDTFPFQNECSGTKLKWQDENEDQKKTENGSSDNEEENMDERSEKKEESTRVKIPRYIPPIMPIPPEVCAASARMERHRTKRRLVVGNVSKWLPVDVREDAATHKWMLYLRGPKDSPDISDIVAKVRYFLHPSYRPHDIVDVVSPFYLTRRGWGEFPARVQVHFAIDGNRPIDIIHVLKLDRTYSGLQTLGGETVVDVWLNNVPLVRNVEQFSVPCNQQNTQKQLFTESQTHILSGGKHELVAHDSRTVVVKQEIGEEEKEEKEHLCEENLVNGSETEGKPEQEGDFSQDDNDSCKPFLSHLCVHHTLPDHDYLGNKPIRLKCTLSMNKSPSRRVSEVKSLKEEEKEEALKTIFNSETLAKVARTKAVTKVDNGLCSESPVIGNGVLDFKSIIQCVDTAGNVLYIDLQKPTSKYKIQNGTSTISSFAQLEHSTSDNALHCADIKLRMSDEKLLLKNVQRTPSASVHAGQSLLKKNYLMPPPSLSSEIFHKTGFSEYVQPKLSLGESFLNPQKLESKLDPNNLLMKATQILPKIFDDSQAVIWLLRQLPLVDKRVNTDSEFRKQHPCFAPSIDKFLEWPVGKRHYAERLRAKEVHSILQATDSKRFTKWSVRHITTWSRLHALTVLPARKRKDQVRQKRHPVSSLRSTVSEPSETQDWLESVAESSKTAEEMEDINVLDVPSPQDLKTSVPMKETTNSMTVQMNSKSNLDFLQKILGRLDIRLAPEEHCSGVLYPAAEELLYSACLSFSEDLLRRSVHEAWKRCQQLPNEIVLCDVQNALMSRCEFDLFTNAGLGVQAYLSESKST